MKIWETINLIEQFNKQLGVIIRMQNDLLRPVMTNVDYIPELYEEYLKIISPDNKDKNKIFIAIAYFLYNPASFVKTRMEKGNLRRAIADVLHVTPSNVSISFADVKILITKHKGFRNDVQVMYDSLKERLKCAS